MAYYIPPRFLNKLAVHITKNFLDLPNVRVPLILGIHGHKGEGKSFQCELVFDLMKVEAIQMSAGELESPDAGNPSRLIRLRYREAAEIIKKHGRMAVLMINDLDAGAGRVDSGTQYTVNTQLVNATLMNIADSPTNVQLPGSYDPEPLPRVPVIVTGNDLGTLYAPLVRDGRMEKFYWEPNREDRIGIVSGIFQPDGLSASEIEQLVDRYEGQSVDFFGALRSRIYDEQILSFIAQVGFDKVGSKIVNSQDKPPEFRQPNFSLPHLFEQGDLMAREQQRIQELRLASAYNRSIAERQSSHQAIPLEQVAFPKSVPLPNGNAQAASGSVSVSLDRQPAMVSPKVSLDTEVVQQVRGLLAQGYQIGLEHVDRRRFRTGSWQPCTTIQGRNEVGAIEALEQCLTTYGHEYIRLFGIDPVAKRRVLETIVHRPT